MTNIRELSIGSYVGIYGSSCNLMTCQVMEILRDNTVGVAIRGQSQDDGSHITGMLYTFPQEQLEGINCMWFNLRELGFTDSDERGWKLVYWFGDMKLLYRHDYKKGVASFRFKTPYRKSHVYISCMYIHELQNVMRFLTGGELEFEYKNHAQ